MPKNIRGNQLQQIHLYPLHKQPYYLSPFNYMHLVMLTNTTQMHKYNNKTMSSKMAMANVFVLEVKKIDTKSKHRHK